MVNVSSSEDRAFVDPAPGAAAVRSVDTAPQPGNRADAGSGAISVVHFQRRPTLRTFSVERLFNTVRGALPAEIECRVAVSRYRSAGLFKRLYNIIEASARQGDVNHVTGDVHFLCYLLHKRRTVLTVLDCVSMERFRGFERMLFRLFWLAIPVRRCAVVVAISEFSRRELLRYVNIPADSVRVIGVPHAADFKPVPGVFRKDKPTILQLGTGANKNLIRSAQALAGIPCHLIIVGALTRAQRDVLLETGIEHENNPRATDAEIVGYYTRCDLVLFASTYEGFGMPIIEANAIGRPVVTSNICSMPEVAGSAASLVDPRDVQSIREGILKVIHDDAYRENLIQNGFRNAARFTPEAIAQQYADIYMELSRRDGIRNRKVRYN